MFKQKFTVDFAFFQNQANILYEVLIAFISFQESLSIFDSLRGCSKDCLLKGL